MSYVMFCAGLGTLILGVCIGIACIYAFIIREFMKGGR
jgi:hypothetical protein